MGHIVGCEPEDWGFSRQARLLGIALWATRKVRLYHMGPAAASNWEAWGTESHDSEVLGRLGPPAV
jgi:hypothetical protein